MKITNEMVLFWDGPFSQWFLQAPFTVDGIEYNCAERWMMAEKARLFGDDETLQKVLMEKSPKKQKALGKVVKNFNDTIWDEHKDSIVYTGSLHKFSQNQGILKILLASGSRTLVEASPLDGVWGIKLDENDPRALDPNQWLGENRLGFALMKARDKLQETNPKPEFDIKEILEL